MPRNALVIRNIQGIQPGDLETALEGLKPNEHAPREFNELLELVVSNNLSDVHQLNRALTLFKLQSVRDYIYETVKEQTGNHIIYHLNGLDDDGTTNDLNVTYVIDKLAKIAPNSAFDMLYLGGGHGDPVLGSSNFSSQQLKSITETLNKKHAKFSAVILGSCFSTAYAGLYQPLLKDNGVMVSNSLECGGDNNFHQAMEWMKGQREEFYSEEDIRSSIKVSREVRSAIRRVLEGTVPQGEKLREQYNVLLSSYQERARAQSPDASNNVIYELGGDLFNEDLNQVIIKMQAEIEPLNIEKIQSILREYPILDKHVKDIAKIRGEKVIFDALVNSLQPTPTSLVLGTPNTLTLFNFSNAVEKPPNAEEYFQSSYRVVLQQVQKSGQFTRINEVSRNFDAVSAKRQFNELFVNATFKAELVERIEHPRSFELQSTTIDNILNTFEEQIQSIGAHHLNAQDTAQELVRNLRQYKIEAFKYVSKQSLETFAQKVKGAINEATPELQRDLGWGDYLANLAKQIVNSITIAVATIVTFGTSNHQGFFAMKSSQATQLAKDLDSSLDKELGPS